MAKNLNNTGSKVEYDKDELTYAQRQLLQFEPEFKRQEAVRVEQKTAQVRLRKHLGYKP